MKRFTIKQIEKEAHSWINERLNNIYPNPILTQDMQQLVGHIIALLKHNESQKASNKLS